MAAGLTTKIKFGFSVLVVPGRNPMLLAKELATLDRLVRRAACCRPSGSAPSTPASTRPSAWSAATGPRSSTRCCPLLRRFWAGETVDHDGAFHHYEGAVVRPAPGPGPARDLAGRHRPVGAASAAAGSATAGCRRSARPRTCATGIAVIQATAAEHDRKIDPEHFGALLPYCDGPIPDIVAAGIAKRRPGVDPDAGHRVRASTACRR